MINATPIEIVLSAPGQKPGDDDFGVAWANGRLHAWVIDGATSVSQKPDKVRPGLSDPAWFARSLSAEIRRIVRIGPLTRGSMSTALRHLGIRYAAAAGQVTAYDPPVAAMTYICIRPSGLRFEIAAIEFADCFYATTPKANLLPSKRSLPAPLLESHLPDDPALLTRLRDRRAAQNVELASSAVTLDPASLHKGRLSRFIADAGTEIVLGSDGYARIWEEYGLFSKSDALRHTARHGALSSLVRLRDWERLNAGHGLAYKPADDATVLRIRLGELPQRGKLQRAYQSIAWRACLDGLVTADSLRQR